VHCLKGGKGKGPRVDCKGQLEVDKSKDQKKKARGGKVKNRELRKVHVQEIEKGGIKPGK